MDVITTPGKKWIKSLGQPADTPHSPDVAGFFSFIRGGILFHDLTGEPFAYLVTRPTENFFVSCSMTEEGLRYMFSTSSTDERKLGLEALSYRERNKLADAISTEALCFKASLGLAKHKVTMADFVAMANGADTDEKTRLAFYKVGMTIRSLGVEDDGYLLASTLGRMMLSHHGYSHEGGLWLRKSTT